MQCVTMQCATACYDNHAKSHGDTGLCCKLSWRSPTCARWLGSILPLSGTLSLCRLMHCGVLSWRATKSSELSMMHKALSQSAQQSIMKPQLTHVAQLRNSAATDPLKAVRFRELEHLG